ncbi:MAG: MOSC domain-containing protein [Syntrophales bacterium]|nr:MOSC domain-containing protein [Syntrophales bacterium]
MNSRTGKILSINIGQEVGSKKRPVDRCRMVANFGIEDDAHAGAEIRQVSLLAEESVEKIRHKGLTVTFGDFAENLTTEGIDLLSLPIGTKLRIGANVLIEITQIGKVCHNRCRIFFEVGDCVMPREGIFARVLSGGASAAGDPIAVEP